MEARTRGNSNRCFQYPLGLSTELSISSFWPYTNVPKEGNAGAGRLLCHCSSREELAMVSGTPIHAYRVSSAIVSGSENPEAPRDRQDSSPLFPEKIPVSCLEATQPSIMVELAKAGVARVVEKRLILFYNYKTYFKLLRRSISPWGTISNDRSSSFRKFFFSYSLRGSCCWTTPICDQVYKGNFFPETSEAEVLRHMGCKQCFTVIKVLVPNEIFIF